jgi:hypothetical protein
MVTAPFAQTVFNGANVTSNPPRTQLWALLYAQVHRADDKAYRNILIDDQLFIRKRRKMDVTGLPIIDINTDAVQYGITGWKNKDVVAMLESNGLPADSSLSVLVVEMLPTYDKFFARSNTGRRSNLVASSQATNMQMMNLQQGMSVEYFKNSMRDIGRAAGNIQKKLEEERYLQMEEAFIDQANKEENIRPLTDQLGSERILRTSTLVPVPAVCCTD